MHSSSSFGHRPHHYHRSRTTIYIGGSPYHRGYSSYEDGDSYSSLESAMSSLTPEGQEKLKQINKFEKKIAIDINSPGIKPFPYTSIRLRSGSSKSPNNQIKPPLQYIVDNIPNIRMIYNTKLTKPIT